MMQRKMKDSGIPWIGMIPEDWEVEKGKNLFNLRTSKGNETTELLAATQKFGMYPQRLLEGVVQVSLSTDFMTFKTVHKNDYVISLRSFQGGFEMSDYEGVCSPAYQVFYNKRSICHRFFKILFKSVNFINFINSLTVGIREGKNIQYLDFANSYIPIPPLAEQEAITSWLDDKCGAIDELIDVEQKMIDELEAYRQATITETVTRGLNPDVPMRQTNISWIPEIPEHWEIRPFKEYFSLSKGLSITKADLSETGIPVINYGQIHSKYNKGTGVNQNILKYVPDFYLATDEKAIVHYGDFIFADTSEDVNGCGNCCYIDCDDIIFAGYHSIIARNKKERSKYLAYLFLTKEWRSQIQCQVNGIKVYSVSQSMLGTTKLLIPPLTEQIAIADYLDTKCKEIDDLIALKRDKIETLKQYRQSIIFEAVTGKIHIN